jgi:energy-coupling factor transporter ATP-binding protein EcfA2
MKTGDPRFVYTERIERFMAAADELRQLSRRYTLGRTAVFVAALLLGLVAETQGIAPAGWAAVALVAAFIVLVVLHRRVRRRLAWQESLAGVNREGLHRLNRAWQQLPVRMPSNDVGDHDFAADLDVLGRASVSQLLGPVGTPLGIRTLRGWLLEPADPAEIGERQVAVMELAGDNDLRDTIAGHSARATGSRLRQLETFLEWVEGDQWLAHRKAIYWGALLIMTLLWSLIVLNVAGVLGSTPWLLAALLAYAYTALTMRGIHAVYDRAFAEEVLLRDYPPILRAVEEAEVSAARLVALRGRLRGERIAAHTAVARLQKLLDMSELRRSAFGYFFIQPLTLWDHHVLRALEAWQAEHGARVRGWLDAVAEFEALGALATLAHDEPEWCYPTVGEGSAFEAEQLGHPILPDTARVTNDVTVGPPGSFLLVTGSNMSGKSTLLRSIGINAVLAQAGTVVCAGSLRMPRLRVHTSIRIQDSLEAGVSLFMAELRRMKRIVEAAGVRTAEGGPLLLYLLDEILHGTNSAERRIAARSIIGHLLEQRAIGAVTTHDLSLADDPALLAAAVPVHFTEKVHGEAADAPMTFDYVLRDGVATSTNALRLMKLVGL